MLMNHYLLLGLQADADQRQIKTAYRRMAKRFHPDTNRGSEAAAELFRQLNEAYRILTDPELRTAYDAKLAAEQATQQSNHAEQKTKQKAAQKSRATGDPQQKFNHFLNSLLGALFETPVNPSPKTVSKAQAAPPKKVTTTLRQQPDFNFYYYLAMEKKSPPYTCGADGVYRRTTSSKSQRVNNAASFPRMPGGSLLILLCSSLWSFLNQ